MKDQSSADRLVDALLMWERSNLEGERARILDKYFAELCSCDECAANVLVHCNVLFATNTPRIGGDIYASFTAFVTDRQLCEFIARWIRPRFMDRFARNDLDSNLILALCIMIDQVQQCDGSVREDFLARLGAVLPVEFLVEFARRKECSQRLMEVCQMACQSFASHPKKLRYFLDEVVEDVFIGRFLRFNTDQATHGDVLLVAHAFILSLEVLHREFKYTNPKICRFLGELIHKWTNPEVVQTCLLNSKTDNTCPVRMWMPSWCCQLFFFLFYPVVEKVEPLRVYRDPCEPIELSGLFFRWDDAEHWHRVGRLPLKSGANPHGQERVAAPFRDMNANISLKNYFPDFKYHYRVHVALGYLAARPDAHPLNKQLWRDAGNIFLQHARDIHAVDLLPKGKPEARGLVAQVAYDHLQDRFDVFATNIEVLAYEAKASGCAWCGIVKEHSAKLCAGCCRAVYCNRECQSKDWKVNHKAECAETKTVRELSAADNDLNSYLVTYLDEKDFATSPPPPVVPQWIRNACILALLVIVSPALASLITVNSSSL